MGAVDYSNMELNGEYGSSATTSNFQREVLQPGVYQAEVIKATDLRKSDKGVFSRGVLLAPIDGLGRRIDRLSVFYNFDFPVATVALADGTETIKFLTKTEAQESKLWKGEAYLKAAMNGALKAPKKDGKNYIDAKGNVLSKEETSAIFNTINRVVNDEMRLRWKDGQAFAGERVVIKVGQYTGQDGTTKASVNGVYSHAPEGAEIMTTVGMTADEAKAFASL